jgi:hypothetical protein
MNLNQVTLPSNSVERSAVFYRLLGFRQIVSDMPPDQAWLWREAYLKDPDGNLICLYHAGANRRFPPWRIADEDESPAA